MQAQHPTPLTKAPKNGTAFYIPNPMNVAQKCEEFFWVGNHYDVTWLDRGICYASEADASAACDLMLAALKGGAA